MAIALIAPVARQVAFSLGQASPGAFLYTWAAGQPGVKPSPTFNDADLLVPNTNPLVADATGLFGPIYLSFCVNYDFELRRANGVIEWFQPNVMTGAVVSSAPGPDFPRMRALIK